MKRLFCAVLCIALLLLCACGQETKASTVFATVNGEELRSDEMDYFKARSKSQIINEFAEKYNVTDFGDFWDKDFDGTTPNEALEALALEQAVEAKIKLMLMRDNGVYEDITFAGLKAQAEQYNADHKNSAGTVGLKSIDPETFYTYYISTGEMDLKNKLAETTLKPTQETLDEMKAQYPDLTEYGLIDLVVTKKYEAMLADLIANAVVEKVK